MKRVILILAIVASTFSGFAQDTVYVNKKDGSAIAFKISDVDSISFNRNTDFVLINGVRWATKNVAVPGTFAHSPEASGSFYQWNSKNAWASTGTITGWDGSWKGGFTTPSSFDTWAAANDPSPAGYRVPTYAELQSLEDDAKVTNIWTIQNGVNGRKFTDSASGNSIFIPAAGYRYDSNGELLGVGGGGHIWGSTAGMNASAYFLYFSSDEHGLSYTSYRARGYTVRSVVK